MKTSFLSVLWAAPETGQSAFWHGCSIQRKDDSLVFHATELPMQVFFAATVFLALPAIVSGSLPSLLLEVNAIWERLLHTLPTLVVAILVAVSARLHHSKNLFVQSLKVASMISLVMFAMSQLQMIFPSWILGPLLPIGAYRVALVTTWSSPHTGEAASKSGH